MLLAQMKVNFAPDRLKYVRRPTAPATIVSALESPDETGFLFRSYSLLKLRLSCARNCAVAVAALTRAKLPLFLAQSPMHYYNPSVVSDFVIIRLFLCLSRAPGSHTHAACFFFVRFTVYCPRNSCLADFHFLPNCYSFKKTVEEDGFAGYFRLFFVVEYSVFCSRLSE